MMVGGESPRAGIKGGGPRVQNTRSLLVAVLLLLVGGGGSYAQQSDMEQVKAAIDAYHAALGSLDIAKMEPLWVHDANIMLINPRDKSISIGWDAVQKNWEATFNNNSEIKVTQAEGPHIAVNGNVAWSTGIANVVGKAKSGASINAPTFETDVFEKRGGKWLLVSHTASRVPQ
jgi:ketosteroid isomerase-like protein